MRLPAKSKDGKLAYICHIFPYLTQTFVYREVEELRRAGDCPGFGFSPAVQGSRKLFG